MPDDVSQTIIVRCACGWEIRGNEQVVTEATQEHGRRVHNMVASREEVLAMAVDTDLESSEADERPA